MTALLPLQRGITWAAFVLALAQVLFLINLVWSVKHGAPADANPWRATTLEWAGAQWSQATGRSVCRGPYEYGPPPTGLGGNAADPKDFVVQNEPCVRP